MNINKNDDFTLFKKITEQLLCVSRDLKRGQQIYVLISA